MPPAEPLTRRRIARAALELIDERGFDALTVRSLGARLGVQSPSLYNHVSGKDEILKAVAHLLGEGIDTDTLDRPDLAGAIRDFAHSYRAAFAGHPEVVALLARSEVGNVESLLIYERFIARVVTDGRSADEAIRLLAAVEIVVIGAIVLTFRAGLRDADPRVAPQLAAGLERLPGVDDDAFDAAIDALLSRLLG